MSSFQDLTAEASRILEPVLRRTPVEPSPLLTALHGVPVALKLECLQLTGSFKIRGAYVSLSRLRETGVSAAATVSAGNHGLGMAWAGRALGMSVRIYVPRSVDASKAAHLEDLGSTLVRSEYDGFDDTELWALEDIQRRGLPFVSAYDDPVILAGNGGTLMVEIRAQMPEVETVVVPVGGGGMSGGIAACTEAPAHLVAAQTSASPGLRLSLEKREAVTRLATSATLAAGLEGGIGTTGFEALKDCVDQVVEVSEVQIKEAMRWMVAHHHYIVEPSSAVAIAAALDSNTRLKGPTVVVVSGRNVSYETLQGVMA